MQRENFAIFFVMVMLVGLAFPTAAHDPERADLDESLHDLVVALGNVGIALAAETKIEPVDYQDLKKLLPKKVKGFKQSDLNGERNSMLGIRFSKADAEYDGKDDSRLNISIIDFGSIKGIAGKAMLAWLSAEIDNKSDDGYEKTTEYEGYKAFEKFDKRDNSGKLSLIVGERFLVTVEGEGLQMKDIKRAMDGVDLKKLHKLRNFGLGKES